MLLAACLALMLQQSTALVDLGRLYPYGKEWMPPVTRWLLSDDPTVIPHEQVLAWRKIGKIAHQHFIYLCLQLSSVSCCSAGDQRVDWQRLQVTSGSTDTSPISHASSCADSVDALQDAHTG